MHATRNTDEEPSEPSEDAPKRRGRPKNGVTEQNTAEALAQLAAATAAAAADAASGADGADGAAGAGRTWREAEEAGASEEDPKRFAFHRRLQVRARICRLSDPAGATGG
jgi:hypothetical protein